MAVIQQVASGILCMMVTADDMLWIWAYTMLAFWAGVALIAIRRGRSPTGFDIVLAKFGFVPLLLLTCFITALIWSTMGRH